MEAMLEGGVCVCCDGSVRRLDQIQPILLTHHPIMSRKATATLLGAVFLSSFTIWAVHFQQEQERKVSKPTAVLSHLLTTCY